MNIYPSSLSLGVTSKFDKNSNGNKNGNGTTPEIVKNAEDVLKNILSYQMKNRFIFDKEHKRNKALAIAAGVGIIGVVSAAVGICLIGVGTVAAGAGGVFVATTASEATARGMAAAATAGGVAVGEAVALSGAVMAGGAAVGGAAVAAIGIVVGKIISSLNGKNLMIIIGNKGTDCQVALVRPNIIIDDEWKEIISNMKKMLLRRNGVDQIFSTSDLGLVQIFSTKDLARRDFAFEMLISPT